MPTRAGRVSHTKLRTLGEMVSVRKSDPSVTTDFKLKHQRRELHTEQATVLQHRALRPPALRHVHCQSRREWSHRQLHITMAKYSVGSNRQLQ